MWALQRIICAIACLGCLLWTVPTSVADTPVVPEYHLKTVFLYNLAKFVKWPQAAVKASPDVLRIGVMDDTHVRPAFPLIAKKRVRGRTLELRLITSARDADDCDVVFLNGDDLRLIQLILQRVRTRPILTVGEIPEFTDWGGIIRFRMEGEHTRIDVSLENAALAELPLKSQLLQLCRIVAHTKSGGEQE